jgi:hypothetical protein
LHSGHSRAITKPVISARHVQKPEISHCRKKFYLRKNKLFAIAPVVFAPCTQTYATGLKKT